MPAVVVVASPTSNSLAQHVTAHVLTMLWAPSFILDAALGAVPSSAILGAVLVLRDLPTNMLLVMPLTLLALAPFAFPRALVALELALVGTNVFGT